MIQAQRRSPSISWLKLRQYSLIVYLLIAAGHFAEHLVQLYQIKVLAWSVRGANGILGLWFPDLARTELLHTSWNTLQLTGLILLAPGFKGKARRWWMVALIAQSWHWLEHMLLQIQYLSGYYFFHALKQTSLLEFFFPRVELHFVYNLLVFVPTVIAFLYFWRKR